jgi:hypothetical protein
LAVGQIFSRLIHASIKLFASGRFYKPRFQAITSLFYCRQTN